MENHRDHGEAWLVFPMKCSGEPSMSYNDAVEEALCFGWIDGVIRNIDDSHRAQRFTPRRKGSTYSRPNIERLIWLDERGMLHPDVREDVMDLLTTPYVFPEDIMDALKVDDEVWHNFMSFPESYRRIRVAYVDAARKRPDEFRRRLDNLVARSRENRMVRGYGGIEKYYGRTSCGWR